MKNLYVYLLVRWKIKSRGNVYFETKPDRLYIEIDFMKMDCEGCEFQALLSCDTIYLRKIRKMVVEYHSNPEKIITHLEDSGFFVEPQNNSFVEGENGILIASLS